MARGKPKKTPQTDWAVRLSMALEGKGLTSAQAKAQLAAGFGVTTKALEHWINGLHEPRFDVLVRLADLTEVTTDWILCRGYASPMPKASAWTNLEAALRDASVLEALTDAEIVSLATSIAGAVGVKAAERLQSPSPHRRLSPPAPLDQPTSPRDPKKTPPKT